MIIDIQARYSGQDERFGNDIVRFYVYSSATLAEICSGIEREYEQSKKNNIYELGKYELAEQVFSVIANRHGGKWEYVRTDGCIEFE